MAATKASLATRNEACVVGLVEELAVALLT
jgi:hypothetical protein